MNSKRGRRSPAAILLLVTILSPVLDPTEAVAVTVPFSGTTKSYSGVPLYIRGFIDPKCLAAPGTQCHTTPADDSVEPKSRYETTAQVITMHALGLGLGQPTFAESPGGSTQRVQWEAGPKRFVSCASNSYQRSCSDITSWRIDITVDRAQTEMLEVRHWTGAGTALDVSSRLELYRTRARDDLALEMRRDSTLNALQWRSKWVDDFGVVWCVWADPDASSHPGNIYFGPKGAVPPEAGCDTAKVPRVLAKRYRDEKQEVAAQHVITTIEPLTEEARNYTRPPVMDKVLVGASCGPQEHGFSVPRDPNRPTTVVMDFGDSSTTSIPVPQGTGPYQGAATHQYRCGGSTFFAIKATVAETGLSGYGAVVLDAGGTLYDFSAEGKNEPAVFTPSTGRWRSARGLDLTLGHQATLPTAADYDGDGQTDPATYWPANGLWSIRLADGTVTETYFGYPEDVPVPADYDGDGKANLAIYRPSIGTTFVKWADGSTSSFALGTVGDLPVPANYLGGPAAEVAIFRPSTGTWFIRRPDASVEVVVWGAQGDVPVPGDYDGNGYADVAVYRPTGGVWYVMGGITRSWGTVGDLPTQGDFDGDGRADIAVYRPAHQAWYVVGSTGGETSSVFGSSGDVPASMSTAIYQAMQPGGLGGGGGGGGSGGGGGGGYGEPELCYDGVGGGFYWH